MHAGVGVPLRAVDAGGRWLSQRLLPLFERFSSLDLHALGLRGQAGKRSTRCRQGHGLNEFAPSDLVGLRAAAAGTVALPFHAKPRSVKAIEERSHMRARSITGVGTARSNAPENALRGGRSTTTTENWIAKGLASPQDVRAGCERGRSTCAPDTFPLGAKTMRLRPIVRLFALAVGALAVLGLDAPVFAADATGTWKWTVDIGGNTINRVLKLKQTGDKLTGTINGREDEEVPIEEPKIKDDTVSFKVVRDFGGNKLILRYEGKLSGDTIKGETKIERDGETMTVDWEAKREK
jgi:hypothetical protein